MLKLYNTLTRKKEEVKASDGKQVRVYTCGLTTYDYGHIGNYRTCVFQDVLRRYLEYKGFHVLQVMNLTDVDDKTINGARKQGIPLKQFTRKYEEAFFDDMRKLNIEPAERYPRATEHISEMVKLIEQLLKKGIAYKGDDGSVYYNVRKFKDYGKLSGLESRQLKAGARVRHDSYDKEHASDFALWKAWDEQDSEVFWDTALGKGRPGWHIECSAMSMKYLGESFDLHAGGVDLVFPHHENEIAQSEGATGVKPFVRHWVHCEHLVVEGKKMSKSLGNFYTLRDVLARGHSPMGVRWLLLNAHYRQQLNFTFEALADAENTIKKLENFAQQMKEVKREGDGREAKEIVDQTVSEFEHAMDDDLNTPNAIAAVFELVKQANKLALEKKLSRKGAEKVIEAIKKFDKVFGVLEEKEMKISKETREFVERKIRERDAARMKKDFSLADKIREQLAEQGILLEDTSEGTKWKLA